MGVLVHGHEAVACSSGHMRGGTCDMLLIRPAHLSAASSGHEVMHAPARRTPSGSAFMRGDSKAAAAPSVATTGCIAAAIVLLQEPCTRAGLGVQRS